MPFYLYVNGNQVHDEAKGPHAPLSFGSRAEGEAHADALYANAVELATSMRRRKPRRDGYIVATEPPPSSEPKSP